MSRLFSLSTREEPAESRVLQIDGEAAAPVFEALSSETARAITAAIYEEPRTASELADSVDTSLQNVQYHLGKLETAGVVTDVGTAHAESGNQMTLYGPAHDPLVIAAQSPEGGVSREVLKDVLGIVGIVGVLSVFAQWIVQQVRVGDGEVSGPTAGPAQQPAGEVLWGLPPGLVVFVVGVMLVAAWAWYRHRYQPT